MFKISCQTRRLFCLTIGQTSLSSHEYRNRNLKLRINLSIICKKFLYNGYMWGHCSVSAVLHFIRSKRWRGQIECLMIMRFY